MIRDGRLSGQTPRGRTHTSVFLSARTLTIACLSGCPISRTKLAVQHIFCPSGHSSVCQKKCLRLSCLSVHPSVKPVRLTVHLCLCVCLSICLRVCSSFCLSICLSACSRPDEFATLGEDQGEHGKQYACVQHDNNGGHSVDEAVGGRHRVT
jgi:hypothetical protein